MFILKGILRAESQEKILIYLMKRERGYAKGIAEFYQVPVTPIQKQLKRLEEDGIIVRLQLGSLKEYQLNRRNAFYPELILLLEKAITAYPKEIIRELQMERKRPRASGKPVKTDTE